MKWRDAFELVKAQAAKAHGVDATGVPRITNRDASGLIMFGKKARELAQRKLVRQPGLDQAAMLPGLAFDWYRWSLPALGWNARGDQFRMDELHQNALLADSYTDSLWMWLGNLADALDSMQTVDGKTGVPFSVVANPRGSSSTYKAMAMDAYRRMQSEDPASADVKPHKSKAGSPKQPGPVTHPSQVVQPPRVVQAPPVVVDTPHGPQQVVAPPMVTQPEIPRPPQDGEPVAVQPPPVVVDHPDGGQVAVSPPPVVVPASPSPQLVQPPPMVVPAQKPGGQDIVVQPPAFTAPPAAALPIDHPREARAPEGGGETPPKKKHHKKPDPKKETDGGGAVGILLLLAALAFSD